MKSVQKERRFFDATDVIKNGAEELKRLSQNDFQECFQDVDCRWRKCIV